MVIIFNFIFIDEVIDALTYFLDHQDSNFFETGLRMLQKRWEKCIAMAPHVLKLDYIEK